MFWVLLWIQLAGGAAAFWLEVDRRGGWKQTVP